MRKFLFRVGVAIVVLFAVLLVAAFWSDADIAVMSEFIKDEQNPTIKPGWQGNPVDQDNRFMNAEFPFLPKTIDLLKWKLSGNPFEEEKKTDTARLEVKDPTEFLQSDK